MDEFKVPTRAVGVEIFLADGLRMKGRVFLAPDPRHPGSGEQLVSVLNDPREFLPFEVGDDRSSRSLVINKTHIVRVRMLPRETKEVDGELEVVDILGEETEGETILHLTDGTQVAGRVVVDTPESSSRLVDKINNGQRFIPVIRDDGVDIVQRTHVLTLD